MNKCVMLRDFKDENIELLQLLKSQMCIIQINKITNLPVQILIYLYKNKRFREISLINYHYIFYYHFNFPMIAKTQEDKYLFLKY